MEILLTPQQTTKHALSIQIESLWCSKCLYKISSSTMIDIIKKEKEKKKETGKQLYENYSHDG